MNGVCSTCHQPGTVVIGEDVASERGYTQVVLTSPCNHVVPFDEVPSARDIQGTSLAPMLGKPKKT